MKTIHVSSWEEFEERHRVDLKTTTNHEFGRFLFRGQEDADWKLETTLERKWPNLRSMKDYYVLIRRIHKKIESFKKHSWSPSDLKQIDRDLSDIIGYYMNDLKVPALPYLAYLRHHGFPSPLLDWTFSPHVAAYFAFRRQSGKPSANAAIFSYSEMPERNKQTSNDAAIYPLNPKIITHERHSSQRSKYTMCFEVKRFLAGHGVSSEVNFVLHESVFLENRSDQDRLYKFVVPSSERNKVLSMLDKKKINAFSLFKTEEALLETLADREHLAEVAQKL